ncbi:hypothetical protein [Candidatus Harpocratesius sp.]
MGNNKSIKENNILSILKKLMLLSESRGKESSGLALIKPDLIEIIKSNISAHELLKNKKVNSILKLNIKNQFDNNELFSIIGHSRLVTNGSDEIHENNQPVISEKMVTIHNGIIVNESELWRQNPNLTRNLQIDTEILMKLIENHLSNNFSIIESVKYAYSQIEGTATIVSAFKDSNFILFSTNNGNLYYIHNTNKNYIIFASEKFILQQLTKKFKNLTAGLKIEHLEPNEAKLINLKKDIVVSFNLKDNFKSYTDFNFINEKIKKIKDHREIGIKNVAFHSVINNIKNENDDPSLLTKDKDDIYNIKRCTKCLLPFTFPFIKFNDEGVCNYCENYEKRKFKGEESLFQKIEKYRSNNGTPDCLIMLSGGRDSCYMVHYVKKILKMNPVTYTYDWGMVTDLARRNIQRMCGKLGLEHILVSADIRKKRNNIKKNIIAWLKKPDLGMVPLFMAGDKQWYYFANQVQEHLGVKLVFLGTNSLETTYFKTGFCNIPPEYKGNKMNINLMKYYLKNYISNPKYINSTIFDNIFAFKSFYYSKKDYIRLYTYIPWDEKEIVNTLRSQYNWETASDTSSTWRIGDGSASFYNYIYHTIAGFTESDTFRSNQIREGLLSREEALKIVIDENKPRYESIKWYLNIVDLGDKFNEIISIINSVPKLWK